MTEQMAPFRDLTVDEIKKLVDEGRDVVDVREDWEEVLRHAFAPKTPVNIIDLGLVYDIASQPERVDVKMTLTALGCPMAADVMADVRDHLLTLPGIADAGVDIVYEPVWTPERM